MGSLKVFGERLRCVENFGHNYAGVPDTGQGPCSLKKPLAPDDWFKQQLGVWLENYTAAELPVCQPFRAFFYEDSIHVDIIEILLNHGADLTERTRSGRSILHFAVCTTPQRVSAILDQGRDKLDVNVRDTNGRTALHYAAAMDKAAVMMLLLDEGACVNTRDNYHATALHYGVNSAACTKVTIESGVLLQAQDKFGRTALHYATMLIEPKKEVKNLLVRAGVKLETVDLQGKTALHYASEEYHLHEDEEIVRWIDCMWMHYHHPHGISTAILGFVVDNCNYYQYRYSVRWSEETNRMSSTLADKEKTWTVVSDSDEEDYEPSDD